MKRVLHHLDQLESTSTSALLLETSAKAKQLKRVTVPFSTSQGPVTHFIIGFDDSGQSINKVSEWS